MQQSTNVCFVLTLTYIVHSCRCGSPPDALNVKTKASLEKIVSISSIVVSAIGGKRLVNVLFLSFVTVNNKRVCVKAHNEGEKVELDHVESNMIKLQPKRIATCSYRRRVC